MVVGVRDLGLAAKEVSVVLAGGSEDVAWLLRLALGQDAGITVIGQAATGSELTAELLRYEPAVVVVDLDSVDGSILAALQAARELGMATRTLGIATDEAAISGHADRLDSVVLRNGPALDRVPSVVREVADMPPLPKSKQVASNQPDVALAGQLSRLQRQNKELQDRLESLQVWLLSSQTERGSEEENGRLRLLEQRLEQLQSQLDSRAQIAAVPGNDGIRAEIGLLTQKLALMQMWLESSDTNDRLMSQAEEILRLGDQLGEVQAQVTDIGSASAPSFSIPGPTIVSSISTDSGTGPAYTLALDAFFNAQHWVTVNNSPGALHPHSWRVQVRLEAPSLGRDHLLVGFAEAKQLLRGELGRLDGTVLNNLPDYENVQPTTENVAATIYNNLSAALTDQAVNVQSVTVWESPTNSVTYTLGRS